MPVAAVGAVDFAGLAVVILLLLLFYIFMTLGDNAPSGPIIGDSIKNIFYGAGNWCSDRAGDILNLIVSGTGWVISQTIHNVWNEGLSVSDAIKQVVTVFWGAVSGTIEHEYQNLVNGAIGGTVSYLGEQVFALRSDVTALQQQVGSIHIPAAFNPADILHRLSWIENNVLPTLEQQMAGVMGDISGIKPRVTSLESTLFGVASYVNTLLPKTITRVSTLESEIVGLLTDVPNLRTELHKFESAIAGQITALGNDEAAIKQWITANSDLLTKLTILTAISALGAVGIQTLIQNGLNPCRCLSLGGDYEWLIPIVMYDTWQSM